MPTRFAITCWFALAATLAFTGPAAAQADADLAVLRDLKVEATGPAVLAFLEKRTPKEEVIKKIDGLIVKLGDEEHEVREKATTDLVEIGPLARGKLTAAMNDKDAEVRRRARWALERISPAADDSRILPAAARVLAARKPAGADEALLALLPHIESSDVAEDVAESLAPLAVDKEGKPTPAVLKAMASKSVVQRYAAGMALAKAGEATRALARKLLEDRTPGVKRRVAMALLEAKDNKALPALVSLVDSPSEDDASAAEEALYAVAGDKAPEAPAGDDTATREKVKKVWEKWYKDEGVKVDLTKLEPEAFARGHLLCGVMDVRGVNGRVYSLDNNGKVRWKVEGLRYPVHASMTRHDRLLVSEYNNSRVAEFDLKGKVLWTRSVPNQPVCAYRLRNGHTFIASRNQMVVLDRAHKEIRTINRPGYDIATAFMFDDGKIAMVSQSGQYIRYDKDGKQLNTFNLGRFLGGGIGMKAHFMPDGGVIIPEYSYAKVRSFDKDGKQLWEASVSQPGAVTALPNGNVLVSSRIRNVITELDKNGKLVKTRTVPGEGGRALFIERR